MRIKATRLTTDLSKLDPTSDSDDTCLSDWIIFSFSLVLFTCRKTVLNHRFYTLSRPFPSFLQLPVASVQMQLNPRTRRRRGRQRPAKAHVGGDGCQFYPPPRTQPSWLRCRWKPATVGSCSTSTIHLFFFFFLCKNLQVERGLRGKCS